MAGNVSCCMPHSKIIQLNINGMLKDAHRDKMSFEKVFSETVSHEFLHVLLYHLEGLEACNWVDEITAHKLYRTHNPFSLKHWHGGIYGYKEVQE